MDSAPSKHGFYYWVDHTSSFDGNSGVQRVTRLLARAFQNLGRSPLFVNWDEKNGRPRPSSPRELATLSKFGGPIAAGAAVPAFNGFSPGDWLIFPEVPHVTLRKRSPVEGVFSFAKSEGLRMAWIFYDAIPLTTPGYEEMRLLHEAYMRLLQRADHVFPISRAAEADLRAFWKTEGIPGEEKIRTILLPGEFPETPRSSGELPSGPVIRFLSVGSVEKRKNHAKLIAAFQRFCREYPFTDVRLTIVGHVAARLYPLLRRAAREFPRITYMGFISDDRLKELYASSHATVFPSTSEGFGLPILESLWHGKPCLCAGFGAMGEVASGGGCLTVDVRFASEIFEGIRRLVFDGQLRKKLAMEAASRPIKTWKEYAGEIMGHLEEPRATMPVG